MPNILPQSPRRCNVQTGGEAAKPPKAAMKNEERRMKNEGRESR